MITPAFTNFKGTAVLSNTNGWQRLGVVISLLWVVAIAGMTATAKLYGTPNSFFSIDIATKCGQLTATHPQSKSIFAELECKDSPATPQNRNINWGFVLAVSFFPILLAWIFAICTMRAINWVTEGFRNNKES